MMERLGVYWFYSERWWMLVLVAAIFVLILRTSAVRKRFMKQFGLILAKGSFDRPVNRILKNTLYVVGAFFACLAALGPQWGQKMHAIKAQGLDICFAMDLSRSMLAEDTSPSRLEQAKNQLSIFLPRLGGDRAAVTAFAGSGYIAAPLTVDHAALANFLKPLQPDFISNQATRLDVGVKTCLEALDLDKVEDSSQLLDASAKLVVLITDGEDTEKPTGDAIKRAEKLGVPVYAMAVGSVKGGPIPLRDDSGRITDYVKDPANGQTVLTKLQAESIRDIARQTGGQVFYLSEGVEAWRRFETAISDYKRESRDAGTNLAREHRFQWPLLIAFLLLLLDFFITETRMRFSIPWKRKKAAEAAIAIFLLSFAASARAVESNDPGVVLLNKQGRSSFGKKDFSQGLDRFSGAIARDPKDLYSRFNWASTLLHSALKEDPNAPPGTPPVADKNIAEQALKEFRSIEKDLGGQGGDFAKELTHQIGQAAELAGQTPEALEAYYKSLAMASQSDAANRLDVATHGNLVRLLQPSSGGGGGEGEGGGKGEGGKGETNRDDQKATRDSSNKPKFSGTDVDEKQAKQIMESVAGEELDVQKRKAQFDAKERSKKEGKDSAGGKPW